MGSDDSVLLGSSTSVATQRSNPLSHNDVFHMVAARRRYTHLWCNPAEGDRQV